MFLPEGTQAQPADGVASITPANPETTSADIALMQRVLSAASRNPNLIPSDFMAYLIDFIQVSNLVIPIGQIFGFRRSSIGTTLSYDEFSVPVSITATTEGTANLVLTSSAAGCSGGAVRVEFFSPAVDSGSPGADSMKFVLQQDGVDIGLFAQVYSPSSEDLIPVHLVRRLVPAAGAHTFSVRAFVSAGTGSVAAGVGTAGNLLPGFIWVTQMS